MPTSLSGEGLAPASSSQNPKGYSVSTIAENCTPCPALLCPAKWLQRVNRFWQ